MLKVFSGFFCFLMLAPVVSLQAQTPIERSWTILKLGLSGEKEENRAKAVDALGLAAQKIANDPDPRSAKALVDAVSDEKWIVRASAISAIAQRGDPSLISAVIPGLDDVEDSVRFNAAAAVIRLSTGKNHK